MLHFIQVTDIDVHHAVVDKNIRFEAIFQHSLRTQKLSVVKNCTSEALFASLLTG